jgi:hypothetical protein
MILHPDEQQALDEISSALAAAEPRLAAMLGMFTRLTAGEGDPPDEDLIVAGWPIARTSRRAPGPRAKRFRAAQRLRLRPTSRGRRPAPAGRRRSARRTPGQALSGIVLPVALLLILVVTLVFGLRSEGTCKTSHPAAARGAQAAVCQGTAPARPAAGSPAPARG